MYPNDYLAVHLSPDCIQPDWFQHSHQHEFPLALSLPAFYKTQSDCDVFIKVNENKLILNK